MNQLVSKELKKKSQSVQSKVKKINNEANRAASSSAAQRRKPPFGQQNFWEKNASLLQENDLEEEEYLNIRN